MGLRYSHSLDEIQHKHCFTPDFYEAVVSLRMKRPIRAEAWLFLGNWVKVTSEFCFNVFTICNNSATAAITATLLFSLTSVGKTKIPI